MQKLSVKSPIDREVVFWCYRNLLGREPESEAVIKAHMKASSLQVLVEEFLRSAEYQARLCESVRIAKANLLNLRPQRIDTQASDDQLRAAGEIIKQGWQALGAKQPHFSVLTNEQFLPDNIDQSIGSFWQSGEREAEAVLRTLKRLGLDVPAAKTCVEFGCGVGRVTMGLARHFANVTALDISEGHMQLAEARATELGRFNIEWILVQDLLDLPSKRFDFFYSQIVFQHNPPPVIRVLIDWALASLKRGGIAIFQVPTYSDGYSFEIKKWLEKVDHSDMQMHCFPQAEIFDLVSQHGCRLLEVREDNRTGETNRYISNTFAVARPRS